MYFRMWRSTSIERRTLLWSEHPSDLFFSPVVPQHFGGLAPALGFGLHTDFHGAGVRRWHKTSAKNTTSLTKLGGRIDINLNWQIVPSFLDIRLKMLPLESYSSSTLSSQSSGRSSSPLLSQYALCSSGFVVIPTLHGILLYSRLVEAIVILKFSLEINREK